MTTLSLHCPLQGVTIAITKFCISIYRLHPMNLIGGRRNCFLIKILPLV